MSRIDWAAELVELLAWHRAHHVDGARWDVWTKDWTPKTPRHLGDSPSAGVLRQLLRMMSRVPGLPPFELARFSGRAGETEDEWFLRCVGEVEAWLGLAPLPSADESGSSPRSSRSGTGASVQGVGE